MWISSTLYNVICEKQVSETVQVNCKSMLFTTFYTSLWSRCEVDQLNVSVIVAFVRPTPFPRSWHRFPPIAGLSDMAGTGGRRGGAPRRPPWTLPLPAAKEANCEEHRRGRWRQNWWVSSVAPQAEDVGLPRRRLCAILCSGHVGSRLCSVRQFGLSSSLQIQLDLSSGLFWLKQSEIFMWGRSDKQVR